MTFTDLYAAAPTGCSWETP